VERPDDARPPAETRRELERLAARYALVAIVDQNGYQQTGPTAEVLDLRPLAHPQECCGFGGTFSVKNPDTSVAMGQDKVADVEATGAEVVTSADTSCLMHIGGLLSRQGAPVRVLHLAEILASTKADAR